MDYCTNTSEWATFKLTMRLFFVSIIILVIAVLLFCIFAPFGILYSLTGGFTYLGKIIMRISVSIDQLGNVVCGKLLNKIFTKEGNNFGLEDDTVSEVLAKNQHNVTKLGYIVSRILEKLDKNHLQKSLIENEL